MSEFTLYRGIVQQQRLFIPMLALPNRRLVLVEEDCGGGFSICDAVGARDWRIEYVRCMMIEFGGCLMEQGGA